MLVKLKILKRSAGEVGTTLTLFHGSPYSNVDVSEAPLLYYTANSEIARDYALGTVAFTGKPPKGVRTEHGPTVYKVKAVAFTSSTFDVPTIKNSINTYGKISTKG